MNWIIISLITYIVLLSNKNLTIDICDSYLLPNRNNYKSYALLFGFLFPLTIVLLLKTKQMKSVKAIITLAVITFIVIFAVSKSVNLYNDSVDIKASYNQNLSARGTTFDKMKKIVSEKLQVAGLNDTSYYRNVLAITDARKDGAQLLWKWAHEQNPNINYNEVSQLYVDISNNISGLRGELQARETLLQYDVKNWYLLHNRFPNNVFLFYQDNNLIYKPILSDLSRVVNSTGIDNEFKIK